MEDISTNKKTKATKMIFSFQTKVIGIVDANPIFPLATTLTISTNINRNHRKFLLGIKTKYSLIQCNMKFIPSNLGERGPKK